MKLYLAGPMTGIEAMNFPLFNAEAARLRSLGYEVVNPAELNAPATADWLACMREDIKHLVTCDGIALLPGWHNSRGANVELNLMTGLGLEICFADELVDAIQVEGIAA